MEVLQPAAKMLVELSKSQDIVAGDGTTTGEGSGAREDFCLLSDDDFK
jgi:chaperonin GroEL (HSP60 family)